MKITLNAFGTRGDVQPFIALGLGLQRAGYDVCIVTHQIFRDFVEEYDLGFYPLPVDPRQVMINQAITELGNNMLRITTWIRENSKPVIQELFTTTLAANRDSDLMLNSGLSIAGWHVAQKLNVPVMAAFLWPLTPSRHQMGALGKTPPPWLPFRGLANYLSTKVFTQLFYNMLLPLINECRHEILGLPSMILGEVLSLDSPQKATAILYGYSPTVVPKPPDWTEYQQITGYWFLDSKGEYQPDAKLVEFMNAGPPPVSIGFGSMIDHEREAVSQIVIEALHQSGQRGILLGGWGKLGSTVLSDSVFQVDAVPHDWLFPRMATAIHHGGAGTTAAALRAGVPNIIVPFFGDQFFWGEQVHKLGVSPATIPRKKLTSSNLAAAIRQSIDKEKVSHMAGEIGQKIRAEKGVDVAVGLIETFIRQGHM